MAYNPNKNKGGNYSWSKVTRLAIAFSDSNGQVCCAHCDKRFDGLKIWQIDHLVPQSYFRQNGLKVDHSIENSSILCPDCNRERGNKPADEFYTLAELQNIAACQEKAKVVTREQIDARAREFAKNSIKFARQYRSGMFYRLYYK